LDKEVLHKSDVEELIGKRPYEEVKEVNLDAPVEVTAPAAVVAETAAAETTPEVATTPENNSDTPL